MIDFIWSLLTGLVQVMICGGFLILGLKYYEWYDDRFVTRKITQWIAKQNYVTYRILVPPDVNLPISEMQSFFDEAHIVSGNRSQDEIYSQGAGFFDIVLDIIGHDGQMGYYITMEKSRLDLAMGFLKNYYPNIELKPCRHPFKSWPKEWWDQDGLGNGLRNYKGSEVAPAKNDLHPLRNWKKFYNPSGALVSDPMGLLMGTVKNIPENAYLVIQYIFRPHPDAQAKRTKGWEVAIQKLRKQFIENNIVEKSGTTVQVLTEEEEEILQNAQVKMKSKQFKTKLRWLLVYDKRKSSIQEGSIKKGIAAYYQELSTGVQSLKDAITTSTDARYPGGRFGPFDGLVGDWMNKIYWTTGERSYRMKRLYSSIINQGLDMGEDSSSFFLDPGSMASLFHFPQQKITQPINTTVYAANTQPTQAQSADGRSVVIQQYQPAFYIQQPDGTQVPVNPVQPMQVLNPAIHQSMVEGIGQSVVNGQFGMLPQQKPTDLKHQPPDNLPTE
jgi:hypothetical protein